MSEHENIRIFESLSAQGGKKVAVVIGRFSPPTRGHYEVFNKVKEFIRTHKNLGLEAAPIVIVIGGNKSDADKSKNPLTVNERTLFMQASGHANNIIFLSAPNAYAALAMLREKNYEPIAIAAGSDRIDDYKSMLDKYFLTNTGEKITHYKIELQRDDAAIEQNMDKKASTSDQILKSMKNKEVLDVGSISASLARRAVELGYREEFADIVGLKPELADKMFNKIKSSMGL